MALEIKVPPVGESVTEVTVATWNKKEGDFVNQDEILCELESDKATFEFPSEASGVLHIIAQIGETLPIGAVLCSIEPAANGNGQSTPAKPAESISTPSNNTNNTPVEKTVPAAASVVEMKVPSVGESVNEVTISSWSKKDGDLVKQDEVLCELESDKATFELPSEASGVLRIVAQKGETLPIGALICRIEVGAEQAAASDNSQPTPTAEAKPATAEQPAAKTSYATGHASPSAEKILAEKGVNPKQISGTGVDGRITKADALNAEKPAAVTNKAPEAKPATTQPAANTAPAASTSGSREQRRQKLSPLRKTVARRLVAVKNETAMLTTFNEVDMKPIMELRAKYKDKFKEKHGVGLGFMSFFAKAVCVALQEWPAVNAMIDADEIVYNDFCDISIAVSAPKGLVVPVIRNAEKMSFAQIEAEVVRLATKARDNKLTIEEMTGGTFTITNGGVFGSMMSTPIINAPQSAILGMHNIVERPVAINGQVEIRPMMYVALSYDHRIIDGRESVSFLVRVKQLLEDPSRLLLEI
jgi:2-oxoglutarate dehydrogenase E2 component (dihydrolipoamide succinyltransferase)